MNFRDAILETLAQGSVFWDEDAEAAKAREILGRLRKAGPVKNRKFWQLFEERVRRRYERDTGEKLPAAVDWATIMDWLKTNLPKILKMLVPLLLLLI